MSGSGGHLVETRGALQALGRGFLISLHGAAQALKLYPFENQTVQAALEEVHQAARRLLEVEGVLEIRTAGDFVFLNDLRLRLELANYGAFSFLVAALRRHGIGALEVDAAVEASEWGPLLSVLLREPAEDDRFRAFESRLRATPAAHFHVEPEQEGTGDATEAKEAARRTYAYSVQVAKEILTDVRLGRAVNARRVKRAVQGIVDQVLTDDVSVLSMTALRDFDEYTFTHSVNVCILSLVLGQKLGLTKAQLYELGLGALLHDIGKTRIDSELVNKAGKLTEAEWELVRQHPAEGLLALFSMHGFGEIPYRTMLMVYEHHMGIKLDGYPKNRRPRQPTLFGRIVAIADGFDAATSRRVYQPTPQSPDRVLREMRDNPKRGYDPLLVKAFMNVIGVYPAGTVVILDTLELAIVVAPNRDPRRTHQPMVKILVNGKGMPLKEPELADLSETDPTSGLPRRTVIKTTDPDRYGIRVDDYLQ